VKCFNGSIKKSYLCGRLKLWIMTNKYKTLKSEPMIVNEPAVAYGAMVVEAASSDKWNPNIPFHGTQEEWWEHFHRIEQGNFMTIEEADEEFEIWKQQLLANLT